MAWLSAWLVSAFGRLRARLETRRRPHRPTAATRAARPAAGARPGADHRVLQRQQRQDSPRADGLGVVGAVLGIEVGERQL